MAHLDPKPDRFKRGTQFNQLKAEDLNRLLDISNRQLAGPDVQNFGDRVIIDKPDQLVSNTSDIAIFAVLVEFDDYLLCCPLNLGVMMQTGDSTWVEDDQYIAAPPVYDATLGSAALSQQRILVTKPYLLQRTPWEGRTVTIHGVSHTYTYPGTNTTTVWPPALPDHTPGVRIDLSDTSDDQIIRTPYLIGDIIAAAKRPTGYVDPYGINSSAGLTDPASPKLLWQDINEGGRNWIVPPVVGFTGIDCCGNLWQKGILLAPGTLCCGPPGSTGSTSGVSACPCFSNTIFCLTLPSVINTTECTIYPHSIVLRRIDTTGFGGYACQWTRVINSMPYLDCSLYWTWTLVTDYSGGATLYATAGHGYIIGWYCASFSCTGINTFTYQSSSTFTLTVTPPPDVIISYITDESQCVAGSGGSVSSGAVSGISSGGACTIAWSACGTPVSGKAVVDLTIASATTNDSDVLIVTLVVFGDHPEGDITCTYNGTAVPLWTLYAIPEPTGLTVLTYTLKVATGITGDIEINSPSFTMGAAAVAAVNVAGLDTELPDEDNGYSDISSDPSVSLLTSCPICRFLHCVVATRGPAGDFDGAWDGLVTDGGLDIGTTGGAAGGNVRLCVGYKVTDSTFTGPVKKVGISPARYWVDLYFRFVPA